VGRPTTEAFPEAGPYSHVILDRDAKFDAEVVAFLRATGLKPKRTSIRSPWQNGIAERWVGSCRRELLDHMIPLNEQHLRRLVRDYVVYYQEDRIHDALGQDTPNLRPVEKKPVCGGEKKYQRAITLITKPLCEGLDEAEKQVRDTKQLLNLPNADGLVIILNEQVTLAGPSLIMERLGQRLAKTAADGAPYYRNLNHFLHIGEKYTPGDESNYLNLSLSNPVVPGQNETAAFTRRFMEAWASFNSTDRVLRWPGPNTKSC
jgi:hypothetical protein